MNARTCTQSSGRVSMCILKVLSAFQQLVYLENTSASYLLVSSDFNFTSAYDTSASNSVLPLTTFHKNLEREIFAEV